MRLSRGVVEDARAAGCVGAALETNRQGRVRASCSCGYVSTYRNSEADAFEALAHHLLKVVNAQRANGGRPARIVRGRAGLDRVSQTESVVNGL